MENPFKEISGRLNNIESLLLDIKHGEVSTSNNNTSHEDLLTPQQAADLLNLSKSTIYIKVSRNELPYMKQGNRLYFMRSELMEYVKTGKVSTKAELIDNASDSLIKKGLNNDK